jgi:hypothetical protein
MKTKITSAVLALFLMAGCAVKFVSDYDPITDQTTTDLQKKTTEFIITMERSDDLSYAKYSDTYTDLRVAISSLRTRAAAVEKNDLTVQQVDLLSKNLDLMETMHRTSGMKKEELPLILATFDRTYGAILKLEFAKKRQ